MYAQIALCFEGDVEAAKSMEKRFNDARRAFGFAAPGARYGDQPWLAL
jgi:hypothetical protein